VEGSRRYSGQVLADWQEAAQEPILLIRSSSVAEKARIQKAHLGKFPVHILSRWSTPPFMPIHGRVLAAIFIASRCLTRAFL
jgi:hypothetical protein